ncbi:transposase [Candidatus Enterovibrio escicola]
MLKHQIYKGIAKRGEGTIWWLYGFKLQFIINE